MNSFDNTRRHDLQCEISFDLVMEDDMDFIEGVFRVNQGEWQVLIASKRPLQKTEVQNIEIRSTEWPNGIAGLDIIVPLSFNLNKQSLKEVMSEWLGVKIWDEVDGPDSMQLR